MVEGPRSPSEVIVRSLVVEQAAPVGVEGREEGSEWLVVGRREVVVVPGLLQQQEAPWRRHLVIRRGSQTGSIYPKNQPSRRDRDGRLGLEDRRAALASQP